MSKRQYQRFQLADKIEEVCVRTSNKLASNTESLFYVGLQDIQDVFPNASRFKLHGRPIPFLIDSEDRRIEPPRIEFCPDETLEVVLSGIVKHEHVDSALSARNPEFENSVLHKLVGLYNQGNITQGTVINTQEIVKEVWKGIQETKNRMTLIQRGVEAILTQNYELLEYTIPRLFIVLPETSTSRSLTTMIYTKFRLHFICECGEHTLTSGGKIPRLHLAKHEGYVIKKPTQFFEKYGPFLMVMLELVKIGTDIAGQVVPAKAIFDTASSKIIEHVDYSLKYLEESRNLLQISGETDVEGGANAMLGGLGNYLDRIEGMEGMELRQLGSYLKSNNSDNLLGNLYRITTREGRVKWVCHNHYRAGYQEMHTQKLRDVVSLAGGVFDEQLGSVKVNLNSTFTANEFYDALNKAKAGVYDLDITISWDFTKADLETFGKTLLISNVSILRLDLQRFQSSNTGIFLSTTTRYEVLARIIEHVNMKMIHIVISKGLMKLLSLKPKRVSHLRKFTLELIPRGIEHNDFRLLANSLKTNNNLITLDMSHDSIGSKLALTLSEALKINATLTTLNLEYNAIGSKGVFALSEALKINATMTTLNLSGNSIGSEGALDLSKALKINTTLTTLDLSTNTIGNEGALA
ncbi:hypothetical protein BGZ76_004002, partial [Entomortierella beljakovae]